MKLRKGLFVLAFVGFSAAIGLALTIDEIMKYRTIGEVRVSPDGERAVFVVSTVNFDDNVFNTDLWLLDLATKKHFQLTRWGKRDNSPRWSPDGPEGSGRIAFLSDRPTAGGGKDKPAEAGKVNIWVLHTEGGEPEQVTDAKSNIGSFEWLPDGSGFIFSMTDPPTPEEEKRKKEKNDPILVDKNFKYSRLYRFKFGDNPSTSPFDSAQGKLGTREPTLLTKENAHVNNFDVSPDPAGAGWVAFAVQPTPKVPDFRQSDLKLLNLATGDVRDLVNRPGQDSAPQFSPDGKWIVFVSADGGEDWIGNTYVCLVQPDGSGLRNVSKSFDERAGGFGGGGLRWSPDGSRIYFNASERADNRLWEVDVKQGVVRPASSVDDGKAAGAFDLAPDGKAVVFALSDPHTPVELYRAALGSPSAEKLTNINGDYGKGPNGAGKIGQTEVIVYKAHDGMEVEGILVKPVGFEPFDSAPFGLAQGKQGRPGKRYPLLVIIHGGPSGVFDMSFTPRRGVYPVQTFAEQGYLVWLPNPRGSGGFGYAYRRANYRDWGYGDYQDIMRGVDLLIERGLADPERMGVMGWSYGGFMTSWIVSQTSRFKAASVGAGVTNPYSFYGVTDIPEFMEAYFGGKPWEDAENYLRHAAVNYAENAKTPTLIQHGQEDRRVPLSQGEEFYLALRKVGVPVEMVVYPRQPHGIQEPKLLVDAMERNLAWFNRWLLGKEATPEKAEAKP